MVMIRGQIRQRIRQTLWVLSSGLRPVDDAVARRYLNEAEYSLYSRMRRPERQHHVRVLGHVLAAGESHPALLKAALLHDVGKTRYTFGLVSKVTTVVVKTLTPGLFARLGEGEPQGWRIPFALSAQHPDWGADMAAAIGVDPLTVDLIRRHQTRLEGQPQTEADRLLLALQAADDKS